MTFSLGNLGNRQYILLSDFDLLKHKRYWWLSKSQNPLHSVQDFTAFPTRCSYCEFAHMVSSVPLSGFQYVWSSYLYWASSLFFHNWPPHLQVFEYSQTCYSCVFILVNRYSIYSSWKLKGYPHLLLPLYWRFPFIWFHLYCIALRTTLSPLFCHWLGWTLYLTLYSRVTTRS